MGQSSEESIGRMQKQGVAVQVAVKAGLLDECDVCEEVTNPYSGKEQEAYKLANSLFTHKDSLVEDFKNRKELTDLIKNLPEQFGGKCLCERQTFGED